MYAVQESTPSCVPCCLCGTVIQPNPSNMCVNCLRSQVDITEGIQKQIVILFCKECGRYLSPPKQWIKAQLESKELLTFCVKKIKGLNKVKLVDAGFIWTEPHSKRLKVKLTIQKEVYNGTILQQAFVVEYVVQNNMCEQCSKVAANSDQWTAVAQVRQHVEHKRTFLYLEQLILKHGAEANTLGIKEKKDGIDFFYGHRSHCLKFIEFLKAVVPIRYRNDKQLVSQDFKSNTASYKYTFSIELVTICKDDLVLFPLQVFNKCGVQSPLVLCLRVSNCLTFLDPTTLITTQMEAENYWRHPFNAVLSAKALIEYIVLDIEVLGPHHNGYQLADAQVARSSDFGNNDTMFTVRTHLGHLLQPGDNALGYDLQACNIVDPELEK